MASRYTPARPPSRASAARLTGAREHQGCHLDAHLDADSNREATAAATAGAATSAAAPDESEAHPRRAGIAAVAAPTTGGESHHGATRHYLTLAQALGFSHLPLRLPLRWRYGTQDRDALHVCRWRPATSGIVRLARHAANGVRCARSSGEQHRAFGRDRRHSRAGRVRHHAAVGTTASPSQQPPPCLTCCSLLRLRLRCRADQR